MNSIANDYTKRNTRPAGVQINIFATGAQVGVLEFHGSADSVSAEPCSACLNGNKRTDMHLFGSSEGHAAFTLCAQCFEKIEAGRGTAEMQRTLHSCIAAVAGGAL